MNTIRAFIALHLPPAVKQELGRISGELASRVPPGAVRWVRPEQMHLTVRFLGDTPVERLADIQAAMDATAGQYEPFDVGLDAVGCFPNCKRPRVVWVGLVDDWNKESPQLLSLKKSLDMSLVPLGWEPETKPFRAHLTLGRVKDEHAVRESDWTVGVAPLTVAVNAIHLIESELRPTGPVYTIRHRSDLGSISR
jgi:RNA 2',3'-cyclic 3'-phosphodiesterase